MLNNYTHSSPPRTHSKTNPIVKITKKRTIVQKLKLVAEPKIKDHGNRNIISKSKMINKIATK